MYPQIICHVMGSVDGRLLTRPLDGTIQWKEERTNWYIRSNWSQTEYRCLDVRKAYIM